MAYANLNRVNQTIDGFDSIIIMKEVADYPCGVTLDVTGVEDTVIKAGTPILKNANGTKFVPIIVKDGEFGPASQMSEDDGAPSLLGILKTTILTSEPLAPVLTMGTINAAAIEASLGAKLGDELVEQMKAQGIIPLYATKDVN